MNLDLTDEEHAALLRLVKRTIDEDRYPLSPRLDPLKAILAKLEPQSVREPLPPPEVYAPPRATAARRRRVGVDRYSLFLRHPGPAQPGEYVASYLARIFGTPEYLAAFTQVMLV